ncbi:MAG: hypothetical protein RUMPE_00580 [Eubacteriales bacterium SKADARSKE-1]|nr:hypothetical protein [Eubacteriales bacterium SKADARSKE-1]
MTKIKKLSMEELEGISGGAIVVIVRKRYETIYEVWDNNQYHLYQTFDTLKEAERCAKLHTSWENWKIENDIRHTSI